MKETTGFQFENEIPWGAGHGVSRQVYIQPMRADFIKNI